MNKVVCAILGGLIMAVTLISAGMARPAHSVTISDVLRAHGASHGLNLWTYSLEAWKVSPYEGSPDGKKHNFFLGKVSLSVQNRIFRYEISNPTESISEAYLFDGSKYHFRSSAKDGLVSTTTGDEMSQFAESRVATCGVLPYLQQLLDPRTEAVFLGQTTSGEYKLEVRTASGKWNLFSDQSGLIQRIEKAEGKLVFSDYRYVDGLQLPFNERVFRSGKPVYELGFTRIDPQPKFQDHFFDPSDLSTR